jgi:hypothetical protein
MSHTFLTIDSNNIGRHYIDFSKLDDNRLVDTVIEKIIDEAYYNCINKIIDTEKYLHYIIYNIQDYVNYLGKNGEIFNVSNINHSLVSDEYSFKINISFTYTIDGCRNIEYKREIGSTIDDMIDRGKHNVKIKLSELFKKYDEIFMRRENIEKHKKTTKLLLLSSYGYGSI